MRAGEVFSAEWPDAPESPSGGATDSAMEWEHRVGEALRFAGFESGRRGPAGVPFDRWRDPDGGCYLTPASVDPTALSSVFPGLGRLARLRRRLEGPRRLWLARSSLCALVERTGIDGVDEAELGFRIAVPGAYRKICVALRTRAGETAAIVKLPARIEAVERVRTEAGVLRALAEDPWLAVRVPTVRSLLEWNGVPVLLLDSAPSRPGPRRFGGGHREFLDALLEATGRHRTLEGSSIDLRWSTALMALSRGPVSPDVVETLRLGVRCVTEELRGEPMPVCLAHGDFARWNTRRLDDGALFVFDWEAAFAEAVIGYDALHFAAIPKLLRGGRAAIPSALFRWLEACSPVARDHRRGIWVAFLVELGLAYAKARSLVPDEGEDDVLAATVAAIVHEL